MALGKGLESLIPTKRSGAVKTAMDSTVAPAGVHEINVTEIQVNPHQPRQEFIAEHLEELVQSIKQHGILQPLLVSKTETGYQLIAGERRLRASRLAGLKVVPVIIRKVNDIEKLELALIENIQRSDLSPIEKAESYKKLVEEFGVSQEQAAEKLGVSRSTFANIVRLLDLPGDIQKALADHVITEGHAKILLGLATPGEQLKYFHNIVDNKLSVRALELALHGHTKQTHQRKPTRGSIAVEPHVRAWQDALALKLGTKVTITPNGDEGSITIKYFSAQELSDIVRKITYS